MRLRDLLISVYGVTGAPTCRKVHDSTRGVRPNIRVRDVFGIISGPAPPGWTMFIDGCNAFNPAPAMSDTCEASAPGAEPDATLGLVVDLLEIELREQLAFDVKRGMAEGLAEVGQLLQVGGQARSPAS
jgi:hypothetical protein